MLGSILSMLLGGTRFSVPQPGDGTMRARRRLALKRQANLSIPDGHVLTRQQRRATERLRARASRSAAKRTAMLEKRPGGSAGVR